MKHECKIGMLVCDINGLCYGQTVDILDETNLEDQIVVIPHGSDTTHCLPKRAIRKGESVFDYAPELKDRYEN